MSPATDVEPVRIAVLNDYEVVALGVAAMLADYPRRVRVAEVNVYLHVSEPVDLVLYDAFARTKSGVHLDLDLLMANPLASRAVLYTWEVTAQSVEFAETHGLSGVVSKSVGAGRLVEALERIHAGERVVLPADPYAVEGYLCSCPWWLKYRGTRGPCKHALAVSILYREHAAN